MKSISFVQCAQCHENIEVVETLNRICSGYEARIKRFQTLAKKRRNAPHWRKFKRTAKGLEDGEQRLIRLDDGTIHLGSFYCQEFVMDCKCYNETPGLIPHITHIQAVKPPSKTK